MTKPTDLEIARLAVPLPITEIGKKIGLSAQQLYHYGPHIAKIQGTFPDQSLGGKTQPQGHLILVTAMNPTPAGEGKTTVTVGLGDALSKIGKKTCITLREPSLGPVFGMKGGAAGGGYSQVIPMEDLNLHFTGDIHAVATAHNLLSALIDNRLYRRMEPRLHIKKVYWKRVMDMNDRSLRSMVCGLGAGGGTPRETGFDIAVASEVMAILCLAEGPEDLTRRLANIIVGMDESGNLVRARDFQAQGAMASLLHRALLPNLVQTLEHTPVIVHGGPFANIAHGTNSMAAIKTALSRADYVVTEAGFGADLGAEKFLDIVSRKGGIWPSAGVIVGTLRAVKMHGGVAKADLAKANSQAIRRGSANLLAHAENLTQVYGLPVVIALNRFPSDSREELDLLAQIIREAGYPVQEADVWARGGGGGTGLAEQVVQVCKKQSPRYLYDLETPVEEKISAIARRIYGAGRVDLSDSARKTIEICKSEGLDTLPVCMAKTQYSLSADPNLLGRPRGFDLPVREIRISAGAGFLVALTGDIMTMPGLPKHPAAEGIMLDGENRIHGLF
ncbi:formate--tetrahydrofolate ligase [Spirochaeta lutea]|uniref:Formate--tetrahydrofolate ligase n=1 Tax=Spirochaeta lutea TaxID=1480694 RepID=A0A098QVR3_9SPIO|nr:formate--tetrahydrofolate ligase [Spirochaeta lutea]KGE71666.1 formate--tetrahydrofolate ligase [Spirochaeta lutea]